MSLQPNAWANRGSFGLCSASCGLVHWWNCIVWSRALGWAVLGRHCCSQVLVFSSDGVACQGFKRFWAGLSPRAATRTMASCTLTSQRPTITTQKEYTGERTTRGRGIREEINTNQTPIIKKITLPPMPSLLRCARRKDHPGAPPGGLHTYCFVTGICYHPCHRCSTGVLCC